MPLNSYGEQLWKYSPDFLRTNRISALGEEAKCAMCYDYNMFPVFKVKNLQLGALNHILRNKYI